MIDGTLTINLDPPYLHFHADDPGVSGRLRECTMDDIRAALAEFAQNMPDRWPLNDCVIRLRGKFSATRLSKLGVLQARLEPIPEQVILRLAN